METKAKSASYFRQIMNFPVKMMDVPVSLMRFPVNVMVSGMRTVTDSLQEIQRKSELPVEQEGPDQTADGQGSVIREASRRAVTPYVELFKLPGSVFSASMKALADTMAEIRSRPASGNGSVLGEGAENGAVEVVLLTSQEAALEDEVVLTEDAEALPREILWQIGRPGRRDFQEGWTEAFDYHIGKDLDAVNSPSLPHFLTVLDGPKPKGATERLNVHFTLDRDYASGELVFVYDRWGAEKDQVEVDGKLLTPVQGAGTGKFRHVALALSALPAGDHVLSLTTAGETEAGGHRIDYLMLAAIHQPADKVDGE